MTPNRLTRRTFMAAAAAASMLAVTAGHAFAADKIKVGILSLTSHAGAYVAHERGYFADENLDAELVMFQAAGPMAVAIASGDIDYGVTAMTGALINLAEKGAVKVIGGALTEEKGIDGQKILASNAAYDAGLKTPADLKGKRFGITGTGSSFHYMASKIAMKEGFSTADMELVALQKVPAVIAALKSGQIDAWSIVPHIAKGLAGSDGAKIIGDVADYIDGYQVTTVFTSTANTTEKRDVTERFLKAYSKGIADYNAALVDKTAGEDAANAMVELIHKYVYTDRPLDKAAGPIKAGAMRLQPGCKLNMASVTDQFEWFRAEKLVPETAKLENLVDTSFVETY